MSISSTATRNAPQFCEGLRDIADHIDGLILDLWGCMHDGIDCYPAALDCLKEARRLGKRVGIISNAPRRATLVGKRIAEMGITPDLYDGLYSSGEETWRALRDRPTPDLRHLGRAVYPIIPDKDLSLVDGLGVDLTTDLDRAGFLLVVGVDGPEDTVAQFEEVLRRAAWNGLPLLCANPDLMVHRGDIVEICAGAIAQRYQELGGKVIWFGKPHVGIYQRCLEELKLDNPARVLGVGDSCRTDVAGAAGIGAKALFLGGGIHRDDVLKNGRIDPHLTVDLMRRHDVMADFAMTALAW
ncbi:MAG TPA: TIGR01459 family HAD-type hydrolase [Dongiaceae bacterium]|nr:TIGR01459 family HAD-type hydrolase [Dongiaceae bacterium]